MCDSRRHPSRKAGNYAVIELKLKSNEAEVREDFESLIAMLEVLNYPLAVFVNIGSDNTYPHLVPAKSNGRIAIFAVNQTANGTNVRTIRA